MTTMTRILPILLLLLSLATAPAQPVLRNPWTTNATSSLNPRTSAAAPGLGTNQLQSLSTNGTVIFGVDSNGTTFAAGSTGLTNDAILINSTNGASVFGVDSNGTTFVQALTGGTNNLLSLRTTNGATLGGVRSNHTAFFSNVTVSPFGVEVGVPFRMFSITNPIAITNTVALVSLLSNQLGTFTLPANFLTPGMVIQCDFAGELSSGVALNGITNRVTLGGVVIATNIVPIFVNAQNEPWRISFTVLCQTNGASGSVICEGIAFQPTSIGGVTSGRRLRLASGSVAANTTGALALGFDVQPGTNVLGLRLNTGIGTIKP